MKASRHIDRLPASRIQSAVVHAGGDRGRRGIEILYLFRHVAQIAAVFRQLHRLLHRASRMGRHQIGNQILLEMKLLVHPAVLSAKFFINRVLWLAQTGEHRVAHVLRRHLQLPAHMVPAQFLQKTAALIGQHIVKADTGTDEHFLHSRKRPQFAQQFDVIPMIGFQIAAGRRKKALPVRAHALFHLFCAGRSAEIRRRAAHIMDISLELGILRHVPRLQKKRLVASRLDNPALMEGQRTERTAAEAAPAAYETETDLRERRNPTGRVIRRMPSAHIGKPVDRIHLLLAQGPRRRILHDITVIGIRLRQPFSAEGVRVAVLDIKAFCEGFSVLQQFLVGRENETVFFRRPPVHLAHRPRKVSQFLHRNPRLQSVCNLRNGPFSHAVGDEIRPAFQKNRTAQRI